jgi:hypothetical protein
MKTWKKIALGVAALVLALFGYATWYRAHYSMGVARPEDVGRPDAKEQILVATQGSDFKDSVVRGVLARLEPRGARVKVVDVSALPDVREGEWDAIVILHTWEMEKPPPVVAAFASRAKAREKLVVLTTSGNGGRKLDGVDAISTASSTAVVDGKASEVVARIEKVLSAKR